MLRLWVRVKVMVRCRVMVRVGVSIMVWVRVAVSVMDSDSKNWRSIWPASCKSGDHVHSQIHVLPWSKFYDEGISVFSSAYHHNA